MSCPEERSADGEGGGSSACDGPSDTDEPPPQRGATVGDRRRAAPQQPRLTRRSSSAETPADADSRRHLELANSCASSDHHNHPNHHHPYHHCHYHRGIPALNQPGRRQQHRDQQQQHLRRQEASIGEDCGGRLGGSSIGQPQQWSASLETSGQHFAAGQPALSAYWLLQPPPPQQQPQPAFNHQAAFIQVPMHLAAPGSLAITPDSQLSSLGANTATLATDSQSIPSPALRTQSMSTMYLNLAPAASALPHHQAELLSPALPGSQRGQLAPAYGGGGGGGPSGSQSSQPLYFELPRAPGQRPTMIDTLQTGDADDGHTSGKLASEEEKATGRAKEPSEELGENLAEPTDQRSDTLAAPAATK